MEKFLSCDWGTSSFRLRLVDIKSGKVLDEAISNQGVSVTYQEWLSANRPPSERVGFYKEILSNAIIKMKSIPAVGLPIILSGMASSSVGMQELPYMNFPFAWDTSQMPIQKFEVDGQLAYPLYLVSGFRTGTDIMRGEETMLLGCDVDQATENILIFPGTHSKHVFVRQGIATDFRTYMTGEVFNMLGQKSILSNSVLKGDDPDAFDLGISDALKGNLLHNLFMVRTRQVLHNTSPTSNYQYLSGLLIGTELKELNNTTASIYVVSEGLLMKSYLRALTRLNISLTVYSLNADDVFIRGHCKIARAII